MSDLAELSAAEVSGVSVARAEVDLTRVARDELAVRESQLRAAELVVDGRLDEPVLVRADSDRLHQAVGNLLANAARFCHPGDRVTVGVRAESDLAVLAVVESGPGIAADELPHLFDRLWRGRAAQQAAGSGVGLAVAREIVMAHSGTIEDEADAVVTWVLAHLAEPGTLGVVTRFATQAALISSRLAAALGPEAWSAKNVTVGTAAAADRVAGAKSLTTQGRHAG